MIFSGLMVCYLFSCMVKYSFMWFSIYLVISGSQPFLVQVPLPSFSKYFGPAHFNMNGPGLNRWLNSLYAINGETGDINKK